VQALLCLYEGVFKKKKYKFDKRDELGDYPKLKGTNAVTDSPFEGTK
jgi:hypothetical protein